MKNVKVGLLRHVILGKFLWILSIPPKDVDAGHKFRDWAQPDVHQVHRPQGKVERQERKVYLDDISRLFTQGDVSKWDLAPEASTTTKELKYNKNEAFKFMLNQDTKYDRFYMSV